MKPRPLTQPQFMAIDALVKAELGARPPMPKTGPLTSMGYSPLSDAEFMKRMAAYNEQDDACRAWDRAFKARFKEIDAALSAPAVEDIAA